MRARGGVKEQFRHAGEEERRVKGAFALRKGIWFISAITPFHFLFLQALSTSNTSVHLNHPNEPLTTLFRRGETDWPTLFPL